MAAPVLPLLVGRDRERSALRQSLADALAGHGRLVLIGGEAGIGKTALADALCREASEQHALVLVGHSYDLTDTSPYGPWVDLFGHYTQADGQPLLPDAFAQRGTVGAISSQAALHQQVVAFFVTSAACQPLVLLLDDLQWADPASLDLLRSVARSVTSLPLLILATYRADELTRRHPLYSLLPIFVREANAERVDLGRLAAAAVEMLVTRRYALATADTARLVKYLQERAEGNALFVGELLRSLEETAVLRSDGRHWLLGDLSQSSVPPLLRQVIDGRLDRLDGETQRLLSVAALIGHTIPLNVWAMVGEVGDEMVLDTVERGTGARLLVETEDGAGVQFAHALFREALYEAVPTTRRRRMHRRVGEVLATLPQPDPDAVAAHYQRAGDPRAVEWLIRAGERAERAYAWITAAARFEAALGAMEGGEADAVEQGWLLLRLALMLRYIDPRRSVGHLDEAARAAVVAGDHALGALARFLGGLLRCFAWDLRAGLTEMEAGSAAERALSPTDRARLRDQLIRLALAADTDGRGTLAQWRALVGCHADARALGEEIGSLTTSPAPASTGVGASNHGDACHGLMLAYAALGLPDEAARAAARAREIYRTIGHHTQVAGTAMHELVAVLLPYGADRPRALQDAAVEAEAALTRAGATVVLPPRLAHLPLLYLHGKWAEARRIAAAGPVTHQTVLGIQIVLGPLARAQGNIDLAWTQVREMLPDGPDTEPGGTHFLSALVVQRLAAALAVDADNPVTALAWLDCYDRWLAWGDAVLGRAEGHLGWAAYHRLTGNIEQASKHAEHALAHASKPRQPLALLVAYRTLGELATDARRFDNARRHLDISLTLADGCAAPFERALTLFASAQLYAVTGEIMAAQTILNEVRAICTPLDTLPTIARIEALHAQLIAVPTVAPTYPAGLSAREVEVLRLVAAGLTNAQVAERLFLSPHTINAHLTTIYAKLDVPSRAAAIRFALDHDLR